MKNITNMGKVSCVPSSIAVIALIFLEYTTAHQYYIEDPCRRFHLDQSINMECAGINLFIYALH
jgi:hypothetical protein